MRRAALLLLTLTAATPARAETHAVTIANTGAETIRGVSIGQGSDNRLRSALPPGAQARITYSTGCTADVRISYDSGRTERFAGVDICSDPKIASGQGVLAGPADPSPGPARTPAVATATPNPAAATATPSRAPPPTIPRWTGKSITKRFGGMD